MKNRLKVLRAERVWTQEQLAVELDVTRQTVNAIETQKHDPSSIRVSSDAMTTSDVAASRAHRRGVAPPRANAVDISATPGRCKWGVAGRTQRHQSASCETQQGCRDIGLTAALLPRRRENKAAGCGSA